MAKLTFDVEAFETSRKARYNTNEAGSLLLLFAEYLRNEKPIPCVLKDYVAGAIEASMHKEPEHRNRAFLRELNLSNWDERPPKGDYLEIGMEMDVLIKVGGLSQKTAADKARAAFQKQSGIIMSSYTAIRYYKKYLAQLEKTNRIT